MSQQATRRPLGGPVRFIGGALLAAAVVWLTGCDQTPVEKKVPAELAQWYKPANKRQVWLHTMFKLRESMHAVSLYSERQDTQAVLKWARVLHDKYQGMAKMVPSWQPLLAPAAADALLAAAEAGDLTGVNQQQRRLSRTCKSCHQQWQPLVSALFRSPDYREVMVTDPATGASQPWPEAMHAISETLGLLKIGRVDGDMAMASEATAKLGQQLAVLGENCSQCHRDEAPRERILGETTQKSLAALTESFEGTHDPKVSGRHLGSLGFTVCGRCHSIHRNLGALRNQLADDYLE